MSKHSFINEAKTAQSEHLRRSLAYSRQLQFTIGHLVESNSMATPLVDKIDTIHAVNAQIDQQLDREIAVNFGELKQAQTKLEKVVNRTEARFGHGEVVEQFQRHLESVDKQLRILEHTLEFVNERQHSS